MPRKLQRYAVKADLEEWYDDYEEWEEEETTTTWEKESTTSEILSDNSSTLERNAVEEVCKVLSDSFSLDTIREALNRVHCDPNLAIGLLLDEAAENFQSSLTEETLQGNPSSNPHKDFVTEEEDVLNAGQTKRKNVVCTQEKMNKKTERNMPIVGQEKESTVLIIPHRETNSSNTESYNNLKCTNPVVLVLGHVDVGKSTFLGHILHLTGNVDERFLRKLKKSSLDAGRSDLSYAWILDDQEAEREHGVTMDISIRQVQYKRLYTFMDTPGHYDFLSAVISAASQAQIAILLVDASPGQFETCIGENGPTLEHAIIMKSMGVNRVIVAINKMDQVDYAKDRFIEISTQAMKILTSMVGYSEHQISCIPCSGLSGENILQRNNVKLCSWYTGDTIMEKVDKFCNEETIEDRAKDKHFRMPCMDIVEEKKDSEVLHISGCIMSGKVRVGDNVRIYPSQTQQSWIVRSIMIGEHQVAQAVAGDWSSLVVTGNYGIPHRVGQVLTDPSAPITQGRCIIAQLVMFANGKKPILKGTPIMLHVHCFQGVGVIIDWMSVSRRDEEKKSNLQVTNPRFLKKGDRATVRIRTEMEIFCTPAKMNKKLSRICIRQERQLIASGVVSDIVETFIKNE